MATLHLVSTPSQPDAAVPEDLEKEHWRERLLRGYLAIKSLCLRFTLPVEGEFFDQCVAAFARAYRVAPKGTQARNVDLLSAVTIYQQSLAAGIPVSKSALVEFLGGPKSLGAFHRVLATTVERAPPRDHRVVTVRLAQAILEGVGATNDVVRMVAHIMATHLDGFVLTKAHVGAAALVQAAVLATGREKEVRLTSIAARARVAPSAVERCLITVAARLGKPLNDVPSKCGDIFRELFFAGNLDSPM